MDNYNGNNQPIFIKVDDNQILNLNCIRWVKKMDECLQVCAKSNGCIPMSETDKHKICKLTNPDSYNKLNNFFQ